MRVSWSTGSTIGDHPSRSGSRRAKGLPVSINAGIRDGHDGSVPVSHSLIAFNHLADRADRLSKEDISYFTKKAAVPPSLRSSLERDAAFGAKQPLWRRSSRNAAITIFDGGHEMIPEAVFAFLNSRKRSSVRDEVAEQAFTVLQGDHSETLFRYLLLDECARLDIQRRRNLDKALSPGGDLGEHLSRLNRSYRAILGPLPRKKHPLRSVVTGRLDGDGYRLEKVHFESLPKHRVTANLYSPVEGDGPWPAVLFACGHSANGKAHEAYQRACALLARNGFVVLCYDPISQGERVQLPEAPRFGTTTHTLLNVGSRLVGRSVVWYEAWDGIRSIDYLLSRPEVDASQPVGMTGTSGGGTQTTFLMALDDRIGPAAPSCYIMERSIKFRSSGGIADGCQYLPGEGLHGINHIDYSLMRAPKPTAILAATRDFFDIHSTRRACTDAERVYAALNAPNRHRLFVADNEHGMHIEHRQEAVRWMRQWLYGDDGIIIEPDFEIFDEKEVAVTRTGQVGAEFGDERTVADINQSLAEQLAASREDFASLALPARQSRVRSLLGLRDSLPDIELVRTGEIKMDDGLRIQKIILQEKDREYAVPLPALLFVPPSTKGAASIFCSGKGKNRQIEECISRARTGEIVLAIDLRGFGETRDKGSLSKFYNHEHRTANIAMHAGRPLLGQRVEDLLIAVRFIADRPDVTEPVEIHAADAAGPVALHAAFLDDRAGRVTTEDAISSWIDDILAHPLELNQVGLVVPGVLQFYDLPSLRR